MIISGDINFYDQADFLRKCKTELLIAKEDSGSTGIPSCMSVKIKTFVLTFVI